jgi:hypothetical protein
MPSGLRPSFGAVVFVGVEVGQQRRGEVEDLAVLVVGDLDDEGAEDIREFGLAGCWRGGVSV